MEYCDPSCLFVVWLVGYVTRPFEYGALAELTVTFERYMGAKCSLRWFRLSNQSREKW